MKIRQGYVYKQKGQWYARLDYKNPGMPNKKTVRRKANPNTKSSANTLLKTLLEEYSPQNYIQAKTFSEYAEAYNQRYLIASKYVQGKKVAGQRAWKNRRGFLKPLVDYFGQMNLKGIAYRTPLSPRFGLETPARSSRRHYDGGGRESLHRNRQTHRDSLVVYRVEKIE